MRVFPSILVNRTEPLPRRLIHKKINYWPCLFHPISIYVLLIPGKYMKGYWDTIFLHCRKLMVIVIKIIYII